MIAMKGTILYLILSYVNVVLSFSSSSSDVATKTAAHKTFQMLLDGESNKKKGSFKVITPNDIGSLFGQQTKQAGKTQAVSPFDDDEANEEDYEEEEEDDLELLDDYLEDEINDEEAPVKLQPQQEVSSVKNSATITPKLKIPSPSKPSQLVKKKATVSSSVASTITPTIPVASSTTINNNKNNKNENNNNQLKKERKAFLYQYNNNNNTMPSKAAIAPALQKAATRQQSKGGDAEDEEEMSYRKEKEYSPLFQRTGTAEYYLDVKNLDVSLSMDKVERIISDLSIDDLDLLAEAVDDTEAAAGTAAVAAANTATAEQQQKDQQLQQQRLRLRQQQLQEELQNMRYLQYDHQRSNGRYRKEDFGAYRDPKVLAEMKIAARKRMTAGKGGSSKIGGKGTRNIYSSMYTYQNALDKMTKQEIEEQEKLKRQWQEAMERDGQGGGQGGGLGIGEDEVDRLLRKKLQESQPTGSGSSRSSNNNNNNNNNRRNSLEGIGEDSRNAFYNAIAKVTNPNNNNNKDKKRPYPSSPGGDALGTGRGAGAGRGGGGVALLDPPSSNRRGSSSSSSMSSSRSRSNSGSRSSGGSNKSIITPNDLSKLFTGYNNNNNNAAASTEAEDDDGEVPDWILETERNMRQRQPQNKRGSNNNNNKNNNNNNKLANFFQGNKSTKMMMKKAKKLTKDYRFWLAVIAGMGFVSAFVNIYHQTGGFNGAGPDLTGYGYNGGGGEGGNGPELII